MTASLAQSYSRVFFNPDTCKPFHHDLQWGEMQAGGREATRGTVFTTNDEEHTVVFWREGICSVWFTHIWTT